MAKEYGSGSTNVLNSDPKWIRIHSTIGYRYLCVEAAGSEQGPVQVLRPVGGPQHHHPLVTQESVHLTVSKTLTNTSHKQKKLSHKLT